MWHTHARHAKSLAITSASERARSGADINGKYSSPTQTHTHSFYLMHTLARQINIATEMMVTFLPHSPNPNENRTHSAIMKCKRKQKAYYLTRRVNVAKCRVNCVCVTNNENACRLCNIPSLRSSFTWCDFFVFIFFFFCSQNTKFGWIV